MLCSDHLLSQRFGFIIFPSPCGTREASQEPGVALYCSVPLYTVLFYHFYKRDGDSMQYRSTEDNWQSPVERRLDKKAHIAGRPQKTLQSVVRYQRSRNQSAHQRGFKRMVNIPGRSKGCLTCRRRKVKCGKCKSWYSAGAYSLLFDQTKASLPVNAAIKGATTVKATHTHFVSSSIGPVLKSLSVKREKHQLRRQPKVQTRATGWLSAVVSAGVLVVRLVMKKSGISKESWPLDHSSESRGSPH